MGFRKAKKLLFESRFVDVEEARALGFVNRVYPAEPRRLASASGGSGPAIRPCGSPGPCAKG